MNLPAIRAISATVSRSAIASNATFALNAALCFIRVFFIEVIPPFGSSRLRLPP